MVGIAGTGFRMVLVISHRLYLIIDRDSECTSRRPELAAIPFPSQPPRNAQSDPELSQELQPQIFLNSPSPYYYRPAETFTISFIFLSLNSLPYLLSFETKIYGCLQLRSIFVNFVVFFFIFLWWSYFRSQVLREIENRCFASPVKLRYLSTTCWVFIILSPCSPRRQLKNQVFFCISFSWSHQPLALWRGIENVLWSNNLRTRIQFTERRRV